MLFRSGAVREDSQAAKPRQGDFVKHHALARWIPMPDMVEHRLFKPPPPRGPLSSLYMLLPRARLSRVSATACGPHAQSMADFLCFWPRQCNEHLFQVILNLLRIAPAYFVASVSCYVIAVHSRSYDPSCVSHERGLAWCHATGASRQRLKPKGSEL